MSVSRLRCVFKEAKVTRGDVGVRLPRIALGGKCLNQREFINIYRTYESHVYTVGIVDGGSRELRVPSDASIGTAFAVSEEGHYLTALHVVEREYKEIKGGSRVLALKGIHRHGSEPAFGVKLAEVYPRSDIALLKGPPRASGYIPAAASNVLVGAWICTIGYPLPRFEEEKEKVMIDKRFVSAMISAAFNYEGVRMVELDKHLSHGHSGGPIVTLKGIAIGIAVSHERGWSLTPERVRDGDEWVEKKRILHLPVQFSRGTMLQNVASRLRRHGVPIHMDKSRLPEPESP